MELEELKKTWEQQSMRESEQYSKSELLMIINNKMSVFDEKIRWRDRLEMGACILVIVAFGIGFFTSQSVWTKLGCAVIIFSGIFICYKLIAARRKGKASADFYDRSLQDQLRAELKKVETQKELLESIIWWYLLPPFAGLVLFTIGMPVGIIAKGVYLLMVIVFYGFIWKINQNTARDKLNPIAEQLNDAIEFIENT